MTTPREKVHKLAASLVGKLSKDFPTVSLLGSNPDYGFPRGIIPFPNLSMNWITGGGVPTGKVSEFYGRYAAGKSIILHQMIAITQQLNGLSCLFDVENALNRYLALNLGISIDDLVYFPPDVAEELCKQLENIMIKLGETQEGIDQLTLVGWDSWSQTSCKKEEEGAVGENQFPHRAKLLSQAFRKFTPKLSRLNLAVIFTNQMRANMSGFGSPFEVPGGEAIKHAARLRIELSKKTKLIDEKTKKEFGVECGFYAEKTNLVRPHQRIDFRIYWNVDRRCRDVTGAPSLGVDYWSGSIEHLQSCGMLPETESGKVPYKGKKYGTTVNNYQAFELFSAHPNLLADAAERFDPRKLLVNTKAELPQQEPPAEDQQVVEEDTESDDGSNPSN